ncbi:MAG: hypothetical protein ACJAS4_003386 [Bacteriovoracaceae bacterium]|jgi:hypothetical protein
MKTQKFLFRYFTLAIGFSMLSSSVLANQEMDSFSLLKSNNKYNTLQKKALENTEAAIPDYKATFYDTSIGSPYAKLSYLMISTFPGECKVGANYDLTNVPGKKFGKYTMKPVCAKFKSVAADIVDAREAFFNSVPEVKEFYKQEALAKKEKEEKSSEPQTVAKTSTPQVKKQGSAPSIDMPVSQVASVEAAPVSSVVATTGGGIRNSIGLLPGDKGFDPNDPINAGRSCNPSTTSRTVNDRMICYETEEELAAAVRGEDSIEGKNMLAIQNQKAINEKKKAEYNEGITSGSIIFNNDTCSSSGFSESECSQMKTNSERSLASTEKKDEKETGSDDASTLDNISGIDVSNGKEVDPGEMFNVGSEDEPIMVPGMAINSINEAANKCLKGPDEAEDTNPEKKSNRCEKVAVASCNSEEGYCTELKNKATANDNNVAEEVMPNVKNIRNGEIGLSERLTPTKLDCMKLFTENKEGLTLNEISSDRTFLNDLLKMKEGDIPILSDRIIGVMYTDTQSCNSVLKTANQNFTDVSGKLTILNKVQLCKDILQAAINNSEEGSSCDKALDLLRQKNYGKNDNCIIEPQGNSALTFQEAEAERDTLCGGKKTADEREGCMNRHATFTESNPGEKEIKSSCNRAHAEVAACFRETNEDGQPNYTRVLSGCIGLNAIAQNIKQDESLDDGETSYQSIDSQIKCKLRNEGSMVYAIDYLACRDAAYWYNGAFLTTDLAAPVIGSAMNAYKDADIQGDMQREMASGGVDGQTAALRAQKRKYQAQAGAEAVQGTLQGAKALAMFGNLAMYPTPDVVSNEWCVAGEENTLGLKRVAACSVVHMAEQNNLIKEDLFANQSMKQVMLEKGFESLSKAIVHAIIAGSYKKRSKLVGEVEKALTDADFNQPENQFEAGPSFCSQNPTLPSCSGTGGGRIVNSGADFSFGGIQPQGGGNLNELDNGGLNGTGSPNNAVMPSGKAKEDLGNILATDSNGKFDKGFKKVGAAKVGAGGGGGGDSGGGGGGASGGGGGGGGGDSDAKAGAGPQKGFGKKTFGKYIAGSNGKFTSGGSVGGKKKSSNPFAALSGKGRNRKIASQVEKELLPKKVQLFEVISKRYAAVSKDRLDIAKENLLQKDGTK